MTEKKQKLTGKEQAKLNIRKKFYEKLERKLRAKKLIPITMNKSHVFPEFDDLTKVLIENYTVLEEDIDLEKLKSIEIVYLEDAHFLKEVADTELIEIFRNETFVDDDGNQRKGTESESDSYHYSSAYNWLIKIKDPKKLKPLIEKSLEEPKFYDLEPKAAEILEPIHYKSKKFVRRRRR